jgi:hypothetical protein
MNVGFFARPLDHALHCIIVALSKNPYLVSLTSIRRIQVCFSTHFWN